MVKISKTCPLCGKPVHGSFSLIPPSWMDYFWMRFQKVHPRYLVHRMKTSISNMGIVHGYGGLPGDLDRGMIHTFGRGGSAIFTGNLSYLKMASNPYEHEKAMTGKLLFSYRMHRIFGGRVTYGYSPKILLFQSVLAVIWGIFLCLVMTYLIMTQAPGDFILLMLLILTIFIAWTTLAFLLLFPLIKVSTILEKQPLPRR